MTLVNLIKTSAMGGVTLISLSVFSQSAQAIIIRDLTISGTSVTTSGANNGGSSNADNIINGSGLSGNTPALTGNHEVTSPSNAWYFDPVPENNPFNLTSYIGFDFGSVYTLTGFSVWNNSGIPPLSVGDVRITTSVNGVNYDDYRALQGITDGSTDFNTNGEGFFSLTGYNSVSGPQQFTVTPTDVRFLRLEILSTYGNYPAILNEIQFDGTPVAVPWETDALPVIGSTILFAGGLWARNKFAKPLKK